jgi:uncharacterized membrane protein
MNRHAAITIGRPREEVEGRWHESAQRLPHVFGSGATVTFTQAPGDRGTEIHVDLGDVGPAGKVAEMAQKLTGSEPLAEIKDDLRRFKQLVETGVISRSDGVPEGELAERKLKQRPAQPLEQDELHKAGIA